MLLSLRDRLAIVVAPDRLTVSLRNKGWRPSWQELGALSFEHDAIAGKNWDVALNMLDRWLAQKNWSATDADVVISDAFTRYALLPWSDDLRKLSEIETLARIRFDALFGISTTYSAVSWSLAKHGSPGIACAIPGEFLMALQKIFATHKMPVISITPRFAKSFNTWRHRITGNGMLVSVESGACVLAVMRNDCWHSVRTVKLPADTPQALDALIARELVLQGESEQTPVYLDLHMVLDVSTLVHPGGIRVLGRSAYVKNMSNADLAEVTA